MAEEALDIGAGVFQQRKDTWSNFFRARRFPVIERMIADIHARSGQCRIIDIGGRQEYWNPILPRLASYNAHITITNLEKVQPDGARHFTFQYGNACDMKEYETGSFDLAHSNSVIEHVGNWGQISASARELRRVGRAYYIQTPYFWFPLEPHFRVPCYHWLPEQMRAGMNMRSRLGYFGRAETLDDAMENVQSISLLDRRQFAHLFPDAAVGFERVLGIAKSLIARREA